MALRSLSTAALRSELARREKGAGKLATQHKKLAARLAEIDSELADLGVDGVARRGRPPGRPAGRRGPGRPAGRRGPGRPPKAGRRARASNKLTLADALAKAVRVGSTVSPADAATAVKRIYKTASRTFGIQVATTLARSPVFKKTGRGQYLRKGGAAGAPAKRGRKPKMGRHGRRAAKRGRPRGKRGHSKGSAAKAAPASAPAAAG
ncbi:MAG TPA: hypothetical protein VES36_00190 [Candidatus Limnocylindrales bacterium]|nr:hypothetical protein [Candidatus Limnocylindrales bacterium]